MNYTMLLTQLPFIGEVQMSSLLLFLFVACILCVLAFEFVNGFHDTANAVATVIYTKSLNPQVAVIWSGFWNFIGVLFGGWFLSNVFGVSKGDIDVAMGIVKLVPINDLMSYDVWVGMILIISILFSAIIWNLFTWYFGIPCSSSHTLIGALIGGGLGFSIYYGGAGVNWQKAMDIGNSLLLSPLFGFVAAVALMFILKKVVKAKELFQQPEGDNPPPFWVRALLILTCTLVSFFHGSNDGQKGVGLMMIVLMTFLPMQYGLNSHINTEEISKHISTVENVVKRINTPKNEEFSTEFAAIDKGIINLKNDIKNLSNNKESVIAIRKASASLVKALEGLDNLHGVKISKTEKAILKAEKKKLKSITDWAPTWIMAAIAISLGLGTMIGWKRIVVTIGEKIGKEHLNYAQGASAELVAASTIGLSTGLGLPVSTTHVLSSGIAGAMVASKGIKNLRRGTIVNIALAWLLTLPITILLSLALFAALRFLL